MYCSREYQLTSTPHCLNKQELPPIPNTEGQATGSGGDAPMEDPSPKAGEDAMGGDDGSSSTIARRQTRYLMLQLLRPGADRRDSSQGHTGLRRRTGMQTRPNLDGILLHNNKLCKRCTALSC